MPQTISSGDHITLHVMDQSTTPLSLSYYQTVISLIASVGSSAPRLPSRSNTQSLTYRGSEDIALICQAQASPTPKFR